MESEKVQTYSILKPRTSIRWAQSVSKGWLAGRIRMILNVSVNADDSLSRTGRWIILDRNKLLWILLLLWELSTIKTPF